LSQLKPHLISTLTYGYNSISIEEVLRESLSKDIILSQFCSTNEFFYEKNIHLTNIESKYLLVINMFRYE
jgi:hypothetical protein